MKKKLMITAAFIIQTTCLYSFWPFDRPYVKQTRFLMDTYCTIQAEPGKKTEEAVRKAFERMEYISSYYNPSDKESPVYAFNVRNVPIKDPEMVALVKRALEVSELTEGAFDITVHPLVSLWGFDTPKPSLPEKADIARELKKVDYRNLEIRDNKVYKKYPYVQIELGGIAKGFGIAQAGEILKSYGVKSALIDLGGDLYAIGKYRGKEWRVGINNPRGEGVIGSAEVSDEVLFTSGDYQRYFEKDGVRYHHIFDTRTGYPARGAVSVTVFCDDPVKATGWSAAIFAMGPERALETIKKAPYIKAVIVDEAGRAHYSDNLRDEVAAVKTKAEPGK